MRNWKMILLIGFLCTVAGCNLGTPSQQEEPLLTDTPVPSGRPEVEIQSPETGDEFVVDEQLLVRAVATDPAGVTRIQLFANGQIVKTVSSESLEGEDVLEATLDYTPRSQGEVILRVLAFRGSTASEPDEITITVREDEDDIIVTARPDTSGPIIPNDGVCRALTNVGLNFRSAPTTTRDNVITVLQSGTLAPVVARLGDNSWWKINFNNTLGWVSADFTTLFGNCLNIPIENVVINTPTFTPTFTPSHTPTVTLTPTASHTPVPGVPDLIVTSISGEEMVVIPADSASVMETYNVIITNLGAGPSGQFSAVLRFDETEFDLGVVSNLNRNESIVLTQELTLDAAGEFDIRVDVDPEDEVDEISEINNRGDITIEVTVESP